MREHLAASYSSSVVLLAPALGGDMGAGNCGGWLTAIEWPSCATFSKSSITHGTKSVAFIDEGWWAQYFLILYILTNQESNRE